MKNHQKFGIQQISAIPTDGINLLLKFGDFKSANAFAEWMNEEAVDMRG